MADDVRISKLLSYWLRHKPEAVGLTLDEAGWAPTDAVLGALAGSGVDCDSSRLGEVVRRSDKQRFEFSADGAGIRARQGHSVEVELGWPPAEPPETLYHGTVDRFLPDIRREGLRAMKRHHVHLSPDVETAARVGSRRGSAVVLRIDSAAMARQGRIFHLTANGVWLTEHVPAEFIAVA
jgi:putative RNA 2'-phosphotransferase